MSKRTQKDLDQLLLAKKPITGVSFGERLTFTSSAAQIENEQGTWVFRYRHAGRQREMTLGNYPDMPLERTKKQPELKSASETARAARVMVDLGKDVAGEKRRAKAEAAAARTFREIAEAIARLDKLSRNEDVQQKLGAPECRYDFIVCDEAHKLFATFFGGEIKYTKRYRLGQLLSGLTRHFLLVTATPHNSKEEDLQLFLALLDGDRFEGKFRDGVHQVEVSDLMRRMVKESLLKFDGRPHKLFPYLEGLPPCARGVHRTRGRARSRRRLRDSRLARWHTCGALAGSRTAAIFPA